MPNMGLVLAAERQAGGDGVHTLRMLLSRYLDACWEGNHDFANEFQTKISRKLNELRLQEADHQI
jgi:hypothetical protein